MRIKNYIWVLLSWALMAPMLLLWWSMAPVGPGGFVFVCVVLVGLQLVCLYQYWRNFET